MIPADPRSAPSLEKQCGESLQGTPATGSSKKEDPLNQPIAIDLPAGASAKVKVRAKQRSLSLDDLDCPGGLWFGIYVSISR